MIVKRIVSGAQTGVDIAGLKAAKILGIETGGYVPRSVRTQDGNHPEYIQQYNVIETKEWNYQERTKLNIINSNGTLQIAVNFSSAGEKLTSSLIKKYNKPSFSICPIVFGSYPDFIKDNIISNFKEWLNIFNIKILNVAGNSDKTVREINPDFNIEKWVIKFLVNTLKG